METHRQAGRAESLTIGAVIVEGHAIVSSDGMIADARGEMPPELRNEADWRDFQAALDRAAWTVLGRLGHERHPNRGRRRLVLTRSVSALASCPRDPLAMLWNPAGVGVVETLQHLNVATGVLAVTGGTGAFDLFLPHYDRFVLAEATRYTLPSGRPCFNRAGPREALAAAGLAPEATAMLDAAAGVMQTVWLRRGTGHSLPG